MARRLAQIGDCASLSAWRSWNPADTSSVGYFSPASEMSTLACVTELSATSITLVFADEPGHPWTLPLRGVLMFDTTPLVPTAPPVSHLLNGTPRDFVVLGAGGAVLLALSAAAYVALRKKKRGVSGRRLWGAWL